MISTSVVLAAKTNDGASLCWNGNHAIWEIIVLLVGGLIIGLLGKFLAPGDKDNIPLWLTIVCGIAGMLVGNLVYTALGGSCTTSGVDWLRHIVQIIVAAIFVIVAAMATGRTRRV